MVLSLPDIVNVGEYKAPDVRDVISSFNKKYEALNPVQPVLEGGRELSSFEQAQRESIDYLKERSDYLKLAARAVSASSGEINNVRNAIRQLKNQALGVIAQAGLSNGVASVQSLSSYIDISRLEDFLEDKEEQNVDQASREVIDYLRFERSLSLISFRSIST